MKLIKQLVIENDRTTDIIQPSDYINLCEFDILSFGIRFDIIDFFNSNYYSIDSTRLTIKENPELEYLRPIFIGSELKMSNFKIFTKIELYDFLTSYTEDIEEWGERLNTNFINIFNKLKPYLASLEKCYLLHKEDFKADDSEVTNDISWYDYYILFVWEDNKNNKFYFCEWASD